MSRTASPGYTATVLADVRPARRGRTKKDNRWLWPGYILAGSLGVIDGDPGRGKSLVSLDIAARVTKGLAWPDGTPGTTPGNVLILASEDTREELIHRLNGVGADLSKCILLEDVAGQPPKVPRDIPILEQIITDRKVKFVVIDPIMVYLGVHGGSDQKVREAVSPLAKLAQTTGTTIMMVRHLTKDVKNPLQAGGGSMGLIGQCRWGYLIGDDPDKPERRVMAVVKMNNAPEPPSRSYRLVTKDGLPHVAWEENTEELLGAADLLSHRRVDKAERNEREEAVNFLKTHLREQGGVAWPKDLLKQGAEAGFTQAQLRTAKKKVRVISRKVGPFWFWCLPEMDPRRTGVQPTPPTTPAPRKKSARANLQVVKSS